MDWSAPWPALKGERLILEPTSLDDAAALWKTVDPEGFLYMSLPIRLDPEGFADFLGRLLALPNQKTYTMWHRGEAVGCSSFLDLRPDHRGLEIGFTWIGPEWRGTFVNPEAKRLMMGHAFDALDCLRVQLKCDARNERSARAIAKLGATFEGRLRQHVVLPDGFVRDTLMFSVVAEEWSQVRDGLERRLVG